MKRWMVLVLGIGPLCLWLIAIIVLTTAAIAAPPQDEPQSVTRFFYQESTGAWLYRIDHNTATGHDQARAEAASAFGIPKSDISIVIVHDLSDSRRQNLQKAHGWGGPPTSLPLVTDQAFSTRLDPVGTKSLSAEEIRTQRLEALADIGYTQWDELEEEEVLGLLLDDWIAEHQPKR